MKTKQELLDKLPSSWEDIPFADFIELSKIKIVEQDEFDGLLVGVYNSLSVLSVLTGASVDELGELPLTALGELSTKIHFLITDSTPPFKNTSRITWKKIENISYDALVTYATLSKNSETFFDNMPTIIKLFCVDRLDEDQILQLPTQYVFDSFFLLRKELNTFITDTYQKGMNKLSQQKLTKEEMLLMKTLKNSVE